MIVLFSDYGITGPYIGQVEAVLNRLVPETAVINLFADVPRQNIRAGACLLAAYTEGFPEGTVFFCVVDPGVGSFTDHPVLMEIDQRWYVGPDNGLFDIVAGRAGKPHCRVITWRPEKLSSSFHGRDLYAPVCAMLAAGKMPAGYEVAWQRKLVDEDDPAEIIYIDHFGNAVTGIRARTLVKTAVISIATGKISYAGTFAEVPEGEVFWYENANGLVEIAVNRGRADSIPGISLGSRLVITGNVSA
jgi:hypothetical protein